MTEEAKLSQEEIDKIVGLLDRIAKRRKILIWGYVAAAATMILGEIGALLAIALVGPGGSLGWVLLVPFMLTGFVLWGFGRWANSLRVRSGAS